MVTLYGIKTCDTCKKARVWLEQNGIEHRFHDFRVDGLPESLLQQFIDNLGWGKLLNKNSTSWRQLVPEQQADLDEEKALGLMMEIPTLIKRPVLAKGDSYLLGFKPETYQTFLK
jgi:arsenate reductase (glutaredoxin)